MTETTSDPVESPQTGLRELSGASVRHGPIEIRASGNVTAVDFPERTIDLIVMPYDQPAPVEYEGRVIEEIVAPGAFDGIERRANRVRVNYHHQDHELRHQLGRAVAFYPQRPEGLVAKLRIGRGPDADLALEKAADGDLGASAGFGIMPGGVSWPSRNVRRLTRLFLDHVALTPTPAYEGAQVLAVRAAQPPPPAGDPQPMPVLKQWDLDAWLAREAELNARFRSAGRPG